MAVVNRIADSHGWSLSRHLAVGVPHNPHYDWNIILLLHFLTFVVSFLKITNVIMKKHVNKYFLKQINVIILSMTLIFLFCPFMYMKTKLICCNTK